jgi:hypothetical protein
MDRNFNYAVDLTIMSLGTYLCVFLHERRAGVLGICLVLFGGCFALAERSRRHDGKAFAPELTGD